MQSSDAEGNEKLNTVQAAHLLGVDRTTIFRKIKRGELPAEEFQSGGMTYYRLDLSDLKAYQREREAKVLGAPINQK